MFATCSCRKCKGQIEFDEGYAGLEASCPHCQAIIVLRISRKQLPQTANDQIKRVIPLLSPYTPMSEKQLAMLRKHINEEFNAHMKEHYGDWWPTEGMTMNEWWEIRQQMDRETEQNEAFKKMKFKALGIDLKKAGDPDWNFFWAIGWEENRDLRLDWVKDRLQKAIEQNDLNFFVRFGHELKKKPLRFVLDKVEAVLVSGWADFMGPVPPLSTFTDEALLQYLKMMTHNSSLTFEQIRKTRQRLGLKTKRTDGPQVVGIEFFKDKSQFRFKWVDKSKK
jgi:hypothetical protein